jgi:PAS domain S-box-containing protein
MQSSKPLKFGVDSSPGAEQAAQALLNMRCAVDRCHDAVFITDLAGRIEFVNPAFEALTGYSVSKAVGRDLDLIATEDSDSDAYQAIQDEVARQGIYRGTQQLRRKDGSRFELDLAITAVHDGATRTTNLVYAGRDITEQRILQVELRRIRRMDAIAALAEVEDACRVLPAVIGEDIELQLALGKDLAQVRADPGQIEQALLNLAINARDAMPNGGRLLIETQVVVLDDGFTLNAPGASPGKHVLLAITDSGQGIQAEELGRIFEPFYTTKPEGKGTGLGLAMVECVVKQNGGFISVDSVPGLGSTFNIYLPVAVAASSSKETSEFSTVAVCFPHGCEVLLVVKDEDALRECMVEFLSSIGYQAHAAANRQAAIGISAGADRIDLVISDVVLPDMGGPRLAERLAALRPEMKVCFMSGHAESVALRKGVSDLTRHFLQKPFSLQVLALKILEVLEEQAAAGVAAGGG